MEKLVNHRFIFVTLTILFVVGLGLTPIQAGEDKEDGKDNGAFMGVYPSELDESKMEALDYKGEGIMIDGIVDDGPSDKAGLKAGDILIKIGQDKLVTIKDMRSSLADLKPGDKIKVTAIRKGKEHEFKIVLGEKPKQDILSKTYSWSTESRGAFLGIEMIQLDDELAEYFDVKKGVLIKKVVEDSPADKAKLEAGDIITKIGDYKIKSTEDVGKAMAKHEPDDKVEIDVIRKGKKKTFDAVLAKSTRKQINVMPGMPTIQSMPEMIQIIENGVIVSEKATQLYLENLNEILSGELSGELTEELKQEIEKLRLEMEDLKKDMEKIIEEKEMKEKVGKK